MVNREKVIDHLDAELEKAIPALIDPEEWGTSPRAVAGGRAMLGLVGGPAPPREEQPST